MKIVIGIYCDDLRSPYYGDVYGKAYSDNSARLLKGSCYTEEGEYRGPTHDNLVLYNYPNGHEFRYKEQEKTCWWWGCVPDELGKELIEDWLERRYKFTVIEHKSIDERYDRNFVLAHVKV